MPDFGLRLSFFSPSGSFKALGSWGAYRKWTGKYNLMGLFAFPPLLPTSLLDRDSLQSDNVGTSYCVWAQVPAVIPAYDNVYKEGRISRWQFHTNDSTVLAFHCVVKNKENLGSAVVTSLESSRALSPTPTPPPLALHLPGSLETCLKHLFWNGIDSENGIWDTPLCFLAVIFWTRLVFR